VSLRVLQFGATGQVARIAAALAASRGVTLTALSRAEADLCDPAAVRRAIETADVDLVLNCAAFTAVDAAETAEDEAHAVNAEAPRAMAQACRARNLPFVHLSTDYVFDGAAQAPYREQDAPNPVNAYGRSKHAGEVAVLETWPRSLIVRPSWVFSPGGSTFLSSLFRRLDQAEPLRMVDDQFSRPTAAHDLAAFLLDVAPRLVAAPEGDPLWGLLHYAGEGSTTPCRFAREVFARAGRGPAVEPAPAAAFPTRAPRPVRSVLDTARLQALFGVTPRPWPQAVRGYLAGVGSGEQGGER